MRTLSSTTASRKNRPNLPLPAAEILRDYRIGVESRQASLMGRKEVLGGKAKFGIFGDGKEVAQLAMARAFHKGDVRSGYYRDQTFMFATGMSTISEFFAQLYSITDGSLEPASSGRLMNGHFSTRMVGPDGALLDLANRFNSSSDVSPTGSQMPRLVGLAQASRMFRDVPALHAFTQLSNQGNEVAFGTIGNASAAEGMFWEAINAVGVLQAPLVMSIWDDGYGISVSNDHQHTKGNVGELLVGFARRPGETRGYDIHTVRGWDYPALLAAYAQAAHTARTEHVPSIIHVVEVTQPQGHSTSGSHERYKTAERLAWEAEFDGLRQMRLWIIKEGVATAEALDRMEEEATVTVRDVQRKSFEDYRRPLDVERAELSSLLGALATSQTAHRETLEKARAEVDASRGAYRRDLMRTAADALMLTRQTPDAAREALSSWRAAQMKLNADRYGDRLLSDTVHSPLAARPVPPVFSPGSRSVNGFEVLNACFDAALARMPNLCIFGEDVGRLGDVNQGCAGLQEKYGALRVSDTGIRETTIMGQGIGLAMRGIRPIVEIQYLDYILYALQIMSDDLATVRWRTRGAQMAPVVVRTRGHRLEGVWHSGSPMAGIIHLCRGIHVCVPRNMVQAAGFYNTLLKGDDPAVVVEVLNAYRLKEQLPDNVGQFCLPLGQPEILREGTDVTVVTYGACVRIAQEAADLLAGMGIQVELVDVQTLLPFDVDGVIGRSLQKTNRVLFLDEDVPGGTTAFMMQEVLEKQGAWRWLDAPPATLAAQEHRPAYGSDGDYWSKPSRESLVEAVYALMREGEPARFPPLL